VSRQRLQRARDAGAPKISRAGAQHPAHVPDGQGLQRRIGQVPDADRDVDSFLGQGDHPVQQQQGSTEFQSKTKPAGQQQMGEGSYEATRDYQKDIGEYLEKADVEADAENAKPKSEAEARELEQAEREGKSHSKGEK